MCLVAVYVEPNPSGERSPALSDVAFIECTDDGVTVTDLLGTSRTFEARVRTIDLVRNEVILERKA